MPSSLSKMLTVLNLFDEARPIHTAESICTELEFSASSGYRYIRELCAAGLLARASGGAYMLGVRIVELEYVMRIADPVAQTGSPILKMLAKTTGCDALLSNYHGEHIVNILHERGSEVLNVSYVRGRPHPLFKGAVAKAILPFLARSQLVRIYNAHKVDIDAAGMGSTWLAFWRHLQAIKKLGFSESQGELDANLGGLGVPVFARGAIVGSITAVYSKQRGKMLNREGLVEQLVRASHKMTVALEAGAANASNGK